MPLSRNSNFLDSTDLNTLQRVLDRICRERAIVADSVEGHDIAADLVSLWQRGHYDEEVLLRMFAEIRRSPKSRTPRPSGDAAV